MQMSIVETVDHIHVDTGIESNLRRVLAVLGYTLRDELYHGLPVAHHESFEAPLVLKEFTQHFLVAGSRYAVKVMERRHISQHSGIRSSLERRQIHVVQCPFRHIHRSIVASGLRKTVANPMFRACDHGIIAPEIPLEAIHAGGGNLAAQERVLAGTFDNSAPARVTADIDHRRESPMHACRRSLHGRHPCRLPDRLHIPAASFRKRYRSQCPITVDHVHAEQQRNLQPRFRHVFFLNLSQCLRTGGVEDRAHHVAAYQ